MFWTKHPEHPVLRCSFCNKTQSEVVRLIAGPPPVVICDACVNVCVDIITNDSRAEGDPRPADDKDYKNAPPDPAGPVAVPCGLCGTLTPRLALLWIRDRGVLCPDCVREIAAACGCSGAHTANGRPPTA